MVYSTCVFSAIYFVVPLEIHWIVLPPKVVLVKYRWNLCKKVRYLSYTKVYFTHIHSAI